jgi:hypothetical protein
MTAERAASAQAATGDLEPEPAAAIAGAPGPASPDGRRDLLDRLEIGPSGMRRPGEVAVRRGSPAGCFLYGPYLHLPAGWYRLGFGCRVGRPRWAAQPALGVEVIVLARMQVAWRDFTAAEMAPAGGGSLVFEVSAAHAIDSGNEGRFEFRFVHLGNADLAIAGVFLDRLGGPPPPPPPRLRCWRMLGRLTTSWRGRRRADGSIRVARLTPAGRLAYGGWPYLRLPRGAFRLIVEGSAGTPRRPSEPALDIEVLGQSRWRRRGFNPLSRGAGPPPGAAAAIRLAGHEATVADLARGSIALDFAVPDELALEAGADAPVEIRLHHRGNAALRIDRVDLERVGDDAAAPPPRAAPAPAPRVFPGGRRRIVMIGNCQMETLRLGFSHIEALNRRFEVKYHFVQIPPNLHAHAIRDLENCDIVVAQDIRLWDEFPLRDAIRPGADTISAPLVRFASLWPFDGWNGPSDRDAYAREAPNLTFPYLDGLLGRLRKEIPDRGARFAAYRALAVPRVINYRRLHQLEERRLLAIDRQFGIAIGAFILDNFRRRRVMHTTVRPNWQVFGQLLQCVADRVGAGVRIKLPRRTDRSLKNPQVPVHPRVARDLGVKWADERTRYASHGYEITWERYIRAYIEHYG